MDIKTYLQLLSRRRRKRKISEKKYASMVNQLMLWSVSLDYFDAEPDGGYFDDYWLDDEEQDFDDE
jgi:hypothetical protein